MSLLLAFYTGAAFEEVLLPAEDNVTVTIRLDRARYQLEEDLELHLEGVDGKWPPAPTHSTEEPWSH